MNSFTQTAILTLMAGIAYVYFNYQARATLPTVASGDTNNTPWYFSYNAPSAIRPNSPLPSSFEGFNGPSAVDSMNLFNLVNTGQL